MFYFPKYSIGLKLFYSLAYKMIIPNVGLDLCGSHLNLFLLQCTVQCTFPFKARRGLQRQTLCQHRLCTVIVGLMSDSVLYVCQLGISENVNQWLLAILVSSEFDSFLQWAQGPTPTQPGYRMKGAQCQKIFDLHFFHPFNILLYTHQLPFAFPPNLISDSPLCYTARTPVFWEYLHENYKLFA